MDNPAVTTPAVERLRETASSVITSGNGTTSTAAGKDAAAPATAAKPSHINTTKYDHGWRRIVRNFSPSWFSVTMGTGIVATILIAIPWKADWLYYLSIVFFVLNTCLFAMAFTASVLRYTIWPEIWMVMVADATNSLFLGTVPMGFATLVEMWIAVCAPAWGTWAAYVGWAMWMLDSVVAVAVTLSLAILLYVISARSSCENPR